MLKNYATPLLLFNNIQKIKTTNKISKTNKQHKQTKQNKQTTMGSHIDVLGFVRVWLG